MGDALLAAVRGAVRSSAVLRVVLGVAGRRRLPGLLENPFLVLRSIGNDGVLFSIPRLLHCSNVRVFDVRWLRRSGSSAVSALRGHTKSVASAYFSPVSGRRVVTVCADDRLR